MNRKLVMANLLLRRSGVERAKFLKKHKIFYAQGENCYWHPVKIPSEPYLIKLHNNVAVATNVYFATHDITCNVFENHPEYSKKGRHAFYMGTIEVFDNVFIGANSTIMYNVKIGPNAIVAAGSVVTKDVPPGSVVGGAPARVIGTFDKVLEKRLIYSEQFPKIIDEEVLKNYFWKDR